MIQLIPDTPLVAVQYFDLAVILIVSIVSGGLMVMHRTREGALLPSISQTIAADEQASRMFSLMMSICVPLYYVWIWFWLGPLTIAPWYFYVLVAMSFIAEMIFVWMPATNGRSKQIHQYAAGFVGAVMIAAPFMLLFSSQLGQAAELAIEAYLLVTVIFASLLLVPKLRKYTLQFEIAYCVIFWTLMSFIGHS